MPKKKKKAPGANYVPKFIDPPEEVLAKYRERLVTHFTYMPKFDGDPIAKANEVIEQCKKGWPNCPNNFHNRIRTKAKWLHAGGGNILNWGEVQTKESAKEKAIEQKMDEAFPVYSSTEMQIDHIGRDKIIRNLKPADKKFWRQREQYYRNEFDFNSSSDFALLLEVLSNELKIHKVHQMEFEELERVPDSDGEGGPDSHKLIGYSKMAAEAHRQLQDSLRALGVTRDQRRDELETADGDIASLSLTLDKKLKAIAAKEEADSAEELSGLQRKYMRGDVYNVEGLPRAIHNRLPDAEEMGEIISEAGIKEPKDKKVDDNGF